jgi:hypothetical protein
MCVELSPVAACCEHSNKYQRSIKCKKFRDYLSDYCCLTKDSGTRSRQSVLHYYSLRVNPVNVLSNQKYPLQVQCSRYVAIWQRRDINLILFQDLYVHLHDNTVFPFFRHFSHHINVLKTCNLSLNESPAYSSDITFFVLFLVLLSIFPLL